MEQPPGPGEACDLAKDQWNSFMPPMHWKGDSPRPVEITIDERFSRGRYGQREAIERAVQTWNDFSRHSLGGDFFKTRVGFVHSSTGPGSKDDVGCENFVGGSDDRFSIVRVTEQERWDALGLGASIPAVTARCYSGGSLKRQAILVNVEHLNSEQLMGITLHELGHAIGLRHSCKSESGDPEHIACEEVNRLGEYHPYRVAIMYPIFGASELKQTLRKNDMWRGYCQYQDR